MPEILHNGKTSKDFYLMEVKVENTVAMEWFYVPRAWEDYPLLSRPISVFDADGQTASSFYKVMGKGMETFAILEPGDEITLDGPHGNDLPEAKGTIAPVGDDVEIVPLYFTAKRLRGLNPDTIVGVYLGSSGEVLLVDLYEKVADKVTVDVGGFVTDDIDPLKCDRVMTCGLEIMMRVLCKKYKSLGVQVSVYVPMENRMAYEIGACLMCTCRTSADNKRVYEDGPTMSGSEVFGNE